MFQTILNWILTNVLSTIGISVIVALIGIIIVKLTPYFTKHPKVLKTVHSVMDVAEMVANEIVKDGVLPKNVTWDDAVAEVIKKIQEKLPDLPPETSEIVRGIAKQAVANNPYLPNRPMQKAYDLMKSKVSPV